MSFFPSILSSTWLFCPTRLGAGGKRPNHSPFTAKAELMAWMCHQQLTILHVTPDEENQDTILPTHPFHPQAWRQSSGGAEEKMVGSPTVANCCDKPRGGCDGTSPAQGPCPCKLLLMETCPRTTPTPWEGSQGGQGICVAKGDPSVAHSVLSFSYYTHQELIIITARNKAKKSRGKGCDKENGSIHLFWLNISHLLIPVFKFVASNKKAIAQIRQS